MRNGFWGVPMFLLNVVPARRLGIRSWLAPGAFTKPFTRKTLGEAWPPAWIELLAIPPAMAITLPVPRLTSPWTLAESEVMLVLVPVPSRAWFSARKFDPVAVPLG